METLRYLLQLPFRIPIIGGFLVTAVVLFAALMGMPVAQSINEAYGVTKIINGHEVPAFFEPPGVYWGWVAAGVCTALWSMFWEWLVRIEFLDPFLGIPFKYLGWIVAAIAAIGGVIHLIKCPSGVC